MDAVRVVAVVVVGLGVWALWRRHRYPGGWAFALSFRHEAAREALANGRSKARDAAHRADQAEAAALAELNSAKAAYERRLHSLEQQAARLRNPGSGPRVDGLGELVLFKHTRVVTSTTGTRSIELAGLDARFDPGQKNHSIYLTDATGRVHWAKYPHALPATETQQRFDEDAVRDFAVAIQNAVADENHFRAQIPHQLTTAEQELEEARTDTRAQKAARERLSRVRQSNRQDPHRKVADSELMEAVKDWETLTGRTPPT
ncbi:hypothetical protein ACGFWD_44720 [Streptomyces sp. NPDC048448]|uniref:hypothetical protein n=1 Tax=Streptomyces sp. NPDC048448 TaxID=3365554 RepID=UPI00371ADD3D